MLQILQRTGKQINDHANLGNALKPMRVSTDPEVEVLAQVDSVEEMSEMLQL